MKILILLLFIAIFLQTSFIPINLVLILIIARALVSNDISNYYIALVSGIFLGILSISNIGYWPLALLVIVKIIYMSKKLPLSKNILLITVEVLVLLLLIEVLQTLPFHQNFEISKVVIETLITIPIYYLFRIWEDRFIVKPDIKLKIRSSR